MNTINTQYKRPTAQGMYDPTYEHDACGIGAVVNIDGTRTHDIITKGRQILERLTHRGGAGSDEATGDGAGILMQLPDEYYRAESGFELPEEGKYGVAMLFLSQDAGIREKAEKCLEEAVLHYGLEIIGWRSPKTFDSGMGELAKLAEPQIKQLFIGAGSLSEEAFEHQLYIARRRAENKFQKEVTTDIEDFYVCSMSCRTIVYKGMFLAHQLFEYYEDLLDERCKSALAIVHSRYSTNTFPSWPLAQPFRMVAHNGEINTLRGNFNSICARERDMASENFGDHMEDIKPILREGQSDSMCFDNTVELLTAAGRELPHSIMMMMPEAFGSSYHISTDKRAFYEYHAAIMEPWDGPAAMVFTDGRLLGGTLDRNGLRPCRYTITADNRLVLASETGVINEEEEGNIVKKGRLQPGKMFLVDTVEKRVITDNEAKSRISRQQPYRRWLEQNRIDLPVSPTPSVNETFNEQNTVLLNQVFGYSREDHEVLMLPMAENGQEPLGSMGNDSPIAVVSDREKLVYNYFRQLFAQVTNPPIDPYREGLVMSLMTFTGKQQNLLTESPEHCHQLKLPHPVLTNEDMVRLRSSKFRDFKVTTLDATFDANLEDQGAALVEGIDKLVADAAAAIEKGASLLIISDRKINAERAAIPALIATGAVHHGLLALNLRGQAGLIIETGEAREVQHFCLLCGYGANGINPYLAFETLDLLSHRGQLKGDRETYIGNYINAVKKGILKVMSKMGISTLRSYRGAQLFEAVGLDSEVVNKVFKGTSSRISGSNFQILAAEALKRHYKAFGNHTPASLELPFGGEYSYRQDGEKHGWNGNTVSLLQHAVMYDNYGKYEEYAKIVNEETRLINLRGLFKFKEGNSIPLEEVEPASEIVKRFNTGAISHGSISREAHEDMARAMNKLGGMSNTGEGGEALHRYEEPKDGWNLNSAIKQIASGRFGVTMKYLSEGKEVQIKMAQGAKPGEGGQLPGHKVSDEIAGLRHSTPGVTLISPPPHHDIYSIEDMAQLIFDLKCSNPGMKVSVKLVSEVGVGTVAAGVAKGNADEVLIAGDVGGTGASPLSSIKHAGSPWELGLADAQQTLVLNGLRDRIRVQVDGRLKTGRDVVIGALLGAEQFGFGTSSLIALGCIMMRKCHMDTCPVGIATQNPRLRAKYGGRPEYLMRFMTFIAEDIRRIMANLGYTKFEDMIGDVGRLDVQDAIDHWKQSNLDLSAILALPNTSRGQSIKRNREQTDLLVDQLDWKILDEIGEKIQKGETCSITMPIENINRTVGTIVSNRVTKAHGIDGLPADTVTLNFEGNAGQSFGAFASKGMTLNLVGDANDYVGKGLSGGKIVIKKPEECPFESHENIIVGNTLLYGATGGEVYINGLAGERFAVRNSGVTAVVEGVGDHGCEYMTNGKVVVLGQTGRNFAAGMSGGIAYVFDKHQLFDTLCNLDMVDLEPVFHEEDVSDLKSMIEKHLEHTGSKRAQYILDNWQEMIGRFVKVMPLEYRKALERLKERENYQSEETASTEEVFNG
ncbi:MAG: glutamate synthase large subunit [Lentisphaeria bacterium]|nr:glutamate synthase large subunit [Lentisphaeria bacterium]